MDDAKSGGATPAEAPERQTSPRDPDDRLALGRFVPYRLSVLANTVSRAVAKQYAERFDLAIAEWRVMAVLGLAAPLSAGEVCAHTAMDKVRVSRAVNRLIENDLVTRVTNSTDRRRSDLHLSARGQAIYAEIVPLARAAEAHLLETMTSEELDRLDHLLTKLQQRAECLFGPDDATLDSPND